MKKIAVLIYPYFSLQEITTLTSCLTLWYGEKIDILASEMKLYESEDGFFIMPTKTLSDVTILDYKCVILPGMINPLPALHDEKIITFLRQAKDTNVLIAAISAAPLLLAKAGLLDDVKFTAGFFMQMIDVFPFIHRENFVHQPLVEEKRIITAIGFAFREFAMAVLKRLGYDVQDKFMWPVEKTYSEEELTFYWNDSDYQEFLKDLEAYKKD